MRRVSCRSVLITGTMLFMALCLVMFSGSKCTKEEQLPDIDKDMPCGGTTTGITFPYQDELDISLYDQNVAVSTIKGNMEKSGDTVEKVNVSYDTTDSLSDVMAWFERNLGAANAVDESKKTAEWVMDSGDGYKTQVWVEESPDGGTHVSVIRLKSG